MAPVDSWACRIIQIHVPYMLQKNEPHQGEGLFKKVRPARPQPFWHRGAYDQYVSTTKWRERRWRIFSTVPSAN